MVRSLKELVAIDLEEQASWEESSYFKDLPGNFTKGHYQRTLYIVYSIMINNLRHCLIYKGLDVR